MSKKIMAVLCGLFSLSAGATAGTSLFFMEAQAVAGYSFNLKKPIYFSLHQQEAMQKPSLGFDYIARLSGKSKDYGSLALQVRFAYNESGGKKIEFQIYNAYFRYKAGFSDLWIGHNRPAFGLASHYDAHADLLPTLAMMGYGYDRDWGVGLSRDFQGGDMALSITTGSGMPLHIGGNYLAALRISRGVLNRDNYNIGLSAAHGRPLDVMGYERMSPDPVKRSWAALDFTYLWKNFENRIETAVGKTMEGNTFAVSWRLGMNLLEENRMKVEFQPVFRGRSHHSSVQYFTGISYQWNADLSLRLMHQYFPATRDHRIVVQIYFYKGL